MTLQLRSVAAPIAHLVGPGYLKIVNGHLAFSTGKGSPLRIPAGPANRVVLRAGKGERSRRADPSRHCIQMAWLTSTGHRCHGAWLGLTAMPRRCACNSTRC